MKSWILLASLCSIATIGCSGGGSSLGDGGTLVTLPDAGAGNGELTEIPQVAISGRVVLPNGFPEDPTRLKVLGLFGEASPDSLGAFSITGTAGGRQGAMVLDENGDPLLLGWVKAGDDNQLSTISTAGLLLFLYGGGTNLPFSAWDRVAELLLQHQATRELAGILDAQLAAGNTYLSNPAPEFFEAVERALVAIAPFARQQQALELVNPPDKQSGIAVLIGDREGNTVADVNQVTLMNERRRRAYCFIDRKEGSGYVPEPSFEIPPTASLNGIAGTLIDLRNGTVAWAPVYVGPIGLGQVVPEGEKIVYRLLAVGPGGVHNTQIDLTDAQMRQRNLQLIKALLADAALPFLLGALDTAWLGDLFGSPAFGAFVTDLVKRVYDGSLSGMLTALAGGDLKTGVKLFFGFLASNRDFAEWLVGALYDQVAGRFGVNVAHGLLGKWLDLIAGPLKWAEQLCAAIDFSVVLNDWRISTDAVQWEVSVLPPKVLVVPAKAALSCGEKAAFRVAIKNAGQTLSGDFTYKFTNTASFGDLTSPKNPAYLNDFEATDPLVYYTVRTDDSISGGLDTIEVSVNLLTDNPTGKQRIKQFLGKGKAEVTVQKDCVTSAGYLSATAFTSGCTQVLTAPSSVYPGDEVTITARASYGGVCASSYVWMSYAVAAELDGEPASGQSASFIYDFCYWGTPQPTAPGGVRVDLPDGETHTITFTIDPEIKCPVCVKFEPNGGPCPSNLGNTARISGPALVMSGTGGTVGWSSVRFFEIKVEP